MPTEQPTFSANELQTETWLSIPGYPVYTASTLGRVQSHRYGRTILMKYGLTKKGRYKVQLWEGRKGRWFHVAQVIALTFHGPCPEGMEPDHVDGNKLNDRSENLEYVTHRVNTDRAMANGLCPKGDTHYLHRNPERALRGEASGNSKLTNEQRAEITRRRKAGERLVPLGKEFGVHYTTIADVVRPRRRRIPFTWD